jgi:hypothetical protein
MELKWDEWVGEALASLFGAIEVAPTPYLRDCLNLTFPSEVRELKWDKKEWAGRKPGPLSRSSILYTSRGLSWRNG